MRWLLIIVLNFFITTNGVITMSNINNIKNQIPKTNSNKDQKIITINIEIKDHLPIKPEIKILTKYYLKLFKPQVTIINIINNLNITNENFDLLALNLNQIISEDFTLVLVPTMRAINYYSRTTITLEPLINLGLKLEDAKNVLFAFNDTKLNNDQLLVKLKQILPTTKNKYIALMRKFITF